MIFLKSKIVVISILFSFLFFYFKPVFAHTDMIIGLDYSLRKVYDIPLEKYVEKNYDLYELYLENMSAMTYSIPGYSVDVGVTQTNLADLRSQLQNKTSKQLTILNLAVDAASFAVGGAIVRTAANSALKGVTWAKKRGARTSGIPVNEMLDGTKTYVLYPGDFKSLLFLVEKSYEAPNTIRFICKNEETNITKIVLNNNLFPPELNVNAVIEIPKEQIDNPDYYELKAIDNELENTAFEDRYYDDIVDFDSNKALIASPSKSYY